MYPRLPKFVTTSPMSTTLPSVRPRDSNTDLAVSEKWNVVFTNPTVLPSRSRAGFHLSTAESHVKPQSMQRTLWRSVVASRAQQEGPRGGDPLLLGTAGVTATPVLCLPFRPNAVTAAGYPSSPWPPS